MTSIDQAVETSEGQGARALVALVVYRRHGGEQRSGNMVASMALMTSSGQAFETAALLAVVVYRRHGGEQRSGIMVARAMCAVMVIR